MRVIPFIIIHLSCFLIFWVGTSFFAVVVAISLYWLRIFAIGAFYHRYFSHKAFKTNRVFQFIFALLGATSAQRGPLWWSAHHRRHHVVSDSEDDPHSPVTQSFWQSHMGWFMSYQHFHYDENRVRDWLKYKELYLLDRFDAIIPILLIVILYGLGELAQHVFPTLNTSGLQLVIWGFSISTVCVFHATASINSLAHRYGSRRYKTRDNSKNNFWLAIITLGEGWHNNHHYYSTTAKQGFYWWEIDITYYLLKLMEKLKIIHDLKPISSRRRDRID